MNVCTEVSTRADSSCTAMNDSSLAVDEGIAFNKIIQIYTH